MNSEISRRQFFREAGLVGTTGFAMITANKTEGAIFGTPSKTKMNYDCPKPFRTSETTEASIAMPTRREFTRMINKTEDYKSTVSAVTDLIIKKYRRRR